MRVTVAERVLLKHYPVGIKALKTPAACVRVRANVKSIRRHAARVRAKLVRMCVCMSP